MASREKPFWHIVISMEKSSESLVRVARSGCNDACGADEKKAASYDYGGKLCFEVCHIDDPCQLVSRAVVKRERFGSSVGYTY